MELAPIDGAAALGFLAALAVLLAAVELARHRAGRGTAHRYWSAGLFLVGLTLLMEAVFYLGVVPVPLLGAYLFLVAALVGVLSLGSAESWAGAVRRRLYAGYIAATSVATGLACLLAPSPASIVVGGVVSGSPSLAVVITSSLVTFPAAAVMVVGSIRDALRSRRWRLLGVAAGILVISVAGALYLVSVPITLYFAEFAGVVLLFFGFGVVPARGPATSGTASTTGGD